MKITLTPDLDRLVQQRLASGRYGSEEQVLEAALRALDEQEQSLIAIAEGYSDYQAGRYRIFDDSDADFRQRNNLPPEP
jgi:putative addiction module CopG family antidote